MIVVSLCLSDIPKEKVTKSEKNGKSYVNIVVDDLKQKDKFDNTHCVYMSQTKEQREAKSPKTYVGNGKEFVFKKNTPQVSQPSAADITEPLDDLPW